MERTFGESITPSYLLTCEIFSFCSYGPRSQTSSVNECVTPLTRVVHFCTPRRSGCCRLQQSHSQSAARSSRSSTDPHAVLRQREWSIVQVRDAKRRSKMPGPSRDRQATALAPFILDLRSARPIHLRIARVRTPSGDDALSSYRIESSLSSYRIESSPSPFPSPSHVSCLVSQHPEPAFSRHAWNASSCRISADHRACASMSHRIFNARGGGERDDDSSRGQHSRMAGCQWPSPPRARSS